MGRQDLLRSTILVVGEEPASLRSLERMLGRAGYPNVLATTDPRAAVALHREFQPDLLLLDLLPPGITGLELVEALRAETPPGCFLPIIAVAVDPSPEMRLRALLLGIQDLLTKPVGYLDTVLRVRNLLEIRWLVHERRAESPLVRARAEGRDLNAVA